MHHLSIDHLVYIILLLGFSSCTSTQEKFKPNIVWIVSEDNSKHYLKLFDEHGVATPNIEALAKEGIKYERAFSNGAVCSVARSAIISGCYGPRTASNFHRKEALVPLPGDLKMFPNYLRQAGYFTANNAKEDYNFIFDEEAWDESSQKAHWSHRLEGQPFFYVHNIGLSHESRMHYSLEDMENSPTELSMDDVFVQPNHPDTEIFRYANARYLDLMQKMDQVVGQVVNELQVSNLMDSTFIFYYGDHGGVLPGSKGYINEMGLHVPMVVYIPNLFRDQFELKAGESSMDFVSFIDLAPTVLDLAGLAIPEEMDGKAFLSKDRIPNDVTFGYADRFDEKYDMVRTVRKGKYKYVRNYMSFLPDGLMNNYRYRQTGYQEWKTLYQAGQLNETQNAFFEPKLSEMLFDVEADPFETNNLASNEEMTKVLAELRTMLFQWQLDQPDLSFYPEHMIVKDVSTNPAKYGENHRDNIASYMKIANAYLAEDNGIELIEKSLESSDPIARYWALIAACSLNEKVVPDMLNLIVNISKQEEELYVRSLGVSYLLMYGETDPQNLTDLLYKMEDPLEALALLNMATYFNELRGLSFSIDREKLSSACLNHTLVQLRLEYLN